MLILLFTCGLICFISLAVYCEIQVICLAEKLGRISQNHFRMKRFKKEDDWKRVPVSCQVRITFPCRNKEIYAISGENIWFISPWFFLANLMFCIIPFNVFPVSGKVTIFNPDMQEASEWASSSMLLSPVDFLRKNKTLERVVIVWLFGLYLLFLWRPETVRLMSILLPAIWSL